MSKLCKVIFIVVICNQLHLSYGVTFSCNEDPASCKTQFGAQFENNFKNLHLSTMRIIVTTFIGIANSVKTEITNDESVKIIDKTISDVSKAIEKLNNSENDYQKIGEAIEEILHDLTFDTVSGPEKNDLDALFAQKHISTVLNDILNKMAIDTAELYEEMYSGLRKEDLDAYKEYEQLNEHVKVLKGDGIHPGEAPDMKLAVEFLGNKYDSSYIAVLDGIRTRNPATIIPGALWKKD